MNRMAPASLVMPGFKHITELLQPGQTALCIFTRGERLHIGQDGHGSTGHWVIDPAKQVDVVVFYHRQPGEAADNQIYTAHPDGVQGPDDEERFTLALVDLTLRGTTESNWRSFCGTWTNPIRYWPPRTKATNT